MLAIVLRILCLLDADEETMEKVMDPLVDLYMKHQGLEKEDFVDDLLS